MLHGKTAIVTGSTSGIGLGVARALAGQGANILLNGFGDPAAIDVLCAELAAQHRVKVGYSGADVLVNNAGIQHVAPIESFPEDRWDAVIAINLSAAFHATKAALPHMRARNWGRVVNIASAHGLIASVNKSAYVAAKHGIVGLTKVTALETAMTGITANAIAPGWVLTPLVQKQIDELAAREGLSADEARDLMLEEKQPSGEFATPEQIGDVAAFLCSESAAQIRGIALPVDGGWLAR